VTDRLRLAGSRRRRIDLAQVWGFFPAAANLTWANRRCASFEAAKISTRAKHGTLDVLFSYVERWIASQ
jgi:hypothetical protein